MVHFYRPSTVEKHTTDPRPILLVAGTSTHRARVAWVIASAYLRASSCPSNRRVDGGGARAAEGTRAIHEQLVATQEKVAVIAGDREAAVAT